MTLCTVCEEHITNPVHPETILRQLETWLRQSAPYLMPLFPTIKKTLPDHSNGTTCIHNGKESSLCPYCTTEHIYEWLRAVDAPKGVINRYLEVFNFDLHHKGYEARARARGDRRESWFESEQEPPLEKVPEYL